MTFLEDDFMGPLYKVNQNRWLAQTDTNFLVGGCKVKGPYK